MHLQDVETFVKAQHIRKMRHLLEPHKGIHTNYLAYWLNEKYGHLRQGLRLLISTCPFDEVRGGKAPYHWRLFLQTLGTMRGLTPAVSQKEAPPVDTGEQQRRNWEEAGQEHQNQHERGTDGVVPQDQQQAKRAHNAQTPLEAEQFQEQSWSKIPRLQYNIPADACAAFATCAQPARLAAKAVLAPQWWMATAQREGEKSQSCGTAPCSTRSSLRSREPLPPPTLAHA